MEFYGGDNRQKHLNQVVKVNITISGGDSTKGIRIRCTEQDNFTSVVFLPKVHNLSPSMKRH